jgi:hypothetical protein
VIRIDATTQRLIAARGQPVTLTWTITKGAKTLAKGAQSVSPSADPYDAALLAAEALERALIAARAVPQ